MSWHFQLPKYSRRQAFVGVLTQAYTHTDDGGPVRMQPTPHNKGMFSTYLEMVFNPIILITKVKFWIILTKSEEQFTANPKHVCVYTHIYIHIYNLYVYVYIKFIFIFYFIFIYI